MEKVKFSVLIGKAEKEQIDARIKAEYPRIRTVSELVRAALAAYLKNS